MSDTSPAARPYRVRFDIYDQPTASVSEHCIDRELAYTAEDAAEQVRIRHPGARIRSVDPPVDEVSLRHLNLPRPAERLYRGLVKAFPLVDWQIEVKDRPLPFGSAIIVSGKSSARQYGPKAFRLEDLPAPDVLIAHFRDAEPEGS